MYCGGVQQSVLNVCVCVCVQNLFLGLRIKLSRTCSESETPRLRRLRREDAPRAAEALCCLMCVACRVVEIAGIRYDADPRPAPSPRLLDIARLKGLVDKGKIHDNE